MGEWIVRRRDLLLGIVAWGGIIAGCGSPSPSASVPPVLPVAPPPLLPGWEPVALLKAAKRLGRGVLPQDGTYFWRTEREILFVRSGGMHGVFHVSTLGVDAGKERPLNEINRRLQGRLRGTRVRIASPSQPEGEVHFEPPMVSLSPDGNWLLWQSGLQWTALALEEAGELHWRQPSPLRNPAVWLRDGQHWAELEADAREGRDFLRRVIFHDLRNPQLDRTIETPALEAGAVLGFSPDGRLLICHREPVAPAETVGMTEVDLTSELGTLRPFSVRLPRPGTVIETELSPQGDRLAWVLAEGGAQPQHSLWISRIDGASMTLVGTVPNEPKGAKPADGPPGELLEGGGLQLLRWLPRGNQLSFVVGSSLYRLDLPE